MTNNTIELPAVVNDLITNQNNHDAGLLALCFDEAAEVFDEGGHYIGRQAIKAWNEDVTRKYKMQLAPLGFKQLDSKIILMVKVSGNFPGSPIQLYYHLVVENDLITHLSIKSS